jgi:hypothetical protein
MRTQIARLVKCVTLLGLWSIVIAFTSPLRAEPDTNKTKQRLSRGLASLSRAIDEIKWANVTIYKVQSDLKQRLIQPQRAASAKDSTEIEAHAITVDLGGEGLTNPPFYSTVMRIVPRARTAERFRELLAEQYGRQLDDIEPQESDLVYNLAQKIIAAQRSIPKDYFLITTRDRTTPLLIALVGFEDNPGGGFSLKGSPQAGLDLYDYLKPLDAALYDDLRSAVETGDQSQLANQMFALRDLSEITIAPHTKTRATPIDEDAFEHVLLSISEGRPLRTQESSRIINANLLVDPTLPKQAAAAPNAVEYPYEATVGTDIIASFTAYKLTNDTLPIPTPDWGVELRNNFDEINYPSIWGGRLTLNAILENIKIGAVLPQLRFGDSTIGTSGFGSNQQKIIGGYGIAVSGDFAAPVLQNSGLFNFYLSYSFGEANTDKIILTDTASLSAGRFSEVGYLVRYAAQAYYSFGFYVDAQARHLFRLKIGGTAYGIDGFARSYDADALATLPAGETAPTKLYKTESFNMGSISGKVEYMKVGQAIPWGASVQYLDQSILAGIWIQFAITPRLDLKFDGKYFTPLDKEKRPITHPWENPNLIVPAISLKYHFGG